MQKTIGWTHPRDESDQWDGFNDPGIEHFLGKPIFHLAREINQNALDAADDDLVKVSFRFREIDTDSLPDLNEFKGIIAGCLKSSQGEGKRAISFFENATKMLTKKRLGVLEISDSNTKGIKGPAVNGTPFYAFMKATGQSKKDSQTASGSFGIGKFAPYAVSNLRTIFVSTVYCGDDGKWQQLTQGKSVLMSYNDSGSTRRGVGFWGICDKCKPIEGTLPELNTWLQRAENRQNYPEQKGTTITILGFEPSSDWRKLLAISVAENFFGAIAKSMLEVNIDDQITLAHDSIHDFFENPEMLDAVQNQKDEPERFNNCKSYLLAIQNQNEVQVEPTENRDLGLCTMRLLVRDGMPKKICILRNGMLITDELNRLKSFSDFKDFVAVLECNSSKGNQFLRDMEPPRHDDFEPERLPRKLQSTGKKALSDLAKWARDMLKRHAKNPISNITTLDELKDFFGDEFSNGEGKETEEINPAGEIVIRARPLPRKSTETTTSGIGAGDGGGFSPLGGNGSGGEEGESGGGSTSGKGEGEGEGTGGSGGHDIKSSQKLFNVRAIMTSMDSRRITFTPTVTGEVCLRLMRAGADTDHNIDVIESSGGLIKGGRIIVKVNDGCRITLDVKMERKFDGSIRIVAHEV